MLAVSLQSAVGSRCQFAEAPSMQYNCKSMRRCGKHGVGIEVLKVSMESTVTKLAR